MTSVERANERNPDHRRYDISMESRIFVDRKLYYQSSFDEDSGYKPENRSDFQLFRRWLQKNCTCSATSARNWFLNRFPILSWLPRYDFRHNIVLDLIAGITVGIMHIPQAMGYAMLAELPPIYGMYTSFFPTLMYTFFGTSGHISLGTDALTSLLAASVQRKLVPDCVNLLSPNYNRSEYDEQLHMFLADFSANGENATAVAPTPERIHPIVVIGTLAFMVGVFQIVLGACHAGILNLYMSDQLVSGFTSGAAVIIVASQFGKLFGVKLDNHYEGTMGVYYTFRDVLLLLPERINWTTTGISILCILTLGFVKHLNDRCKKKLPIPIPIDLFLIITVTLISYTCDLAGTHNVRILHGVPTGFTSIQFPEFRFIRKLIPDAAKTAIISYALSISMVQMFARQHRNKVDANQELYAYGIAHMVGSFFCVYPCAASVCRSSVQESAGSKTQLTSGFAAFVILLGIYWLDPLLAPLPVCVLSSIIVVALKNLFLQVTDLPYLWRTSKVDWLIFVVAFLSTIVFDATYGLAISIVFAAFTIVARSQRPKCLLTGKIPNTDQYKSLKKYSKVEEIPSVKIFRFDSALQFANAELFRSQLYSYIKIDFFELRHQIREETRQKRKQEKRSSQNNYKIDVNQGEEIANQGVISKMVASISCSNVKHSVGCYGSVGRKLKTAWVQSHSSHRIQSLALERNPNLPHHIIIDCLGFNYVDITGVNMLAQVYSEMRDINISVLFANCKDIVRDKFELCNFYDRVPKSTLFLTVQDAVTVALQSRELSGECGEGILKY